MPALPLSNTFESGLTDGTAITAGNSGPPAGDAWSTVIGTCTYSTTQVMHDLLACKCDHTAANQTSNVRWTGLGSITTDIYWRVYLWLPAAPNVTFRFLSFHTAAASLCCSFAITTGTKLQMLNSGGVGIGSPGTVNISTATWVRLEGHIIPATSNATIEYRMWNTPDSAGAADDSLSSTTATLGANADRTDIGLREFNSGATFDPYLDDIAYSATDWIGPSVTPTVAVAWITA